MDRIGTYCKTFFFTIGLSTWAGAAFFPGPIQVNNGGGTPTSVGYANGNSSVPVNILALPSNSSVNVNQINGSGVVTGGSGEQVMSVDIRGSSNTVQITGTPAVNVSQVGGNSVVTGGSGEQVISVDIRGSSNTVQGGLADNGVAAGTNRAAVLPGIYQQKYGNGTAFTQGRNAALTIGTEGNAWVTTQPSRLPASFSVSSAPIASMASSPTDVACLKGNATTDVYLQSIRATCTQTTAGVIDIAIGKYSTLATGAFSTMTVVAQSSDYNIASSSAVIFYSNPTQGTLVGNIDNAKIACIATATATPNDVYISPTIWRTKPIVLRGIAESVCINLNGTTITGNKFTFGFNWMETPTITP